MATEEVQQRTDEELRAWDWRGDLERADRSLAWLARQTRRSDGMVYLYARGAYTPPLSWLRAAAAALGVAS